MHLQSKVACSSADAEGQHSSRLVGMPGVYLSDIVLLWVQMSFPDVRCVAAVGFKDPRGEMPVLAPPGEVCCKIVSSSAI